MCFHCAALSALCHVCYDCVFIVLPCLHCAMFAVHVFPLCLAFIVPSWCSVPCAFCSLCQVLILQTFNLYYNNLYKCYHTSYVRKGRDVLDLRKKVICLQ